jgi:hypothetical protein
MPASAATPPQELAPNYGHKRSLHVAIESPSLTTMAGQRKRQQHLQKSEHTTDLIDGVVSSYTPNHTSEDGKEENHKKAPDLTRKIRRFPPNIKPKPGTKPNNTTTTPSICTTRSSTSP